MENVTAVTKKCTTCAYGPLDEDRDPCKTCIAGGTFAWWEPVPPASDNTSQAGLGLGREIGHGNVTTNDGIEAPSKETEDESLKIDETCREAIRRLKEAERVAKTKVDKARQKAIHKALEVLRGIPKPSTAIVIIPASPLTCPVEELEQLGNGRGRAR